MNEKRVILSIALYLLGIGLIGGNLFANFSNLQLFVNKKIVVVKLYGPIYYSSSVPEIGGIPAERTAEILYHLANDSSVKAVVLDINSPGGSFVGAYVLEQAVRYLASKKPVVAVCDEVCASGAYLVASAADKIYVNPGTLTGSIGVIISYLDFAGYLERYNITYVAIKSGKYKDIGSPYRHLTPVEREELQRIVNDSYKILVTTIEKNRNLNISQLPYYIREGGVINGEQAVKYGLADAYGDLFTVIKKLKKEVCGGECQIYQIDTRYLGY